MLALNTHPVLQQLVLDNIYSLSAAEKVKSILILPLQVRIHFIMLHSADLLSLDQYFDMKHKDYLEVLLSDKGIFALHDGLITLEVADALPDIDTLRYLLSDELEKKLTDYFIEIQRDANIEPHFNVNKRLLYVNRLELLKKFVTFAQNNTDDRKFTILLLALKELDENKILPQHAAALPYQYLVFTLDNPEILNEKLITHEKAAIVPYDYLKALLEFHHGRRNRGYGFFEDIPRLSLSEAITPDQARSMHLKHLEFFLDNINALKVLKSGLVSRDEVNGLPISYLKPLFEFYNKYIAERAHYESYYKGRGRDKYDEKEKVARAQFISPANAAKLPSVEHLILLLDWGLQPLSQELITINQIEKLTIKQFSFLLSNEIFLKLRKKSVENKQSDNIWDLLADNVVTVWKEKLITDEDAKRFRGRSKILECYLSDNGIKALRAKWIDLMAYASFDTLELFFSDSGMIVLQKQIMNYYLFNELLSKTERKFTALCYPTREFVPTKLHRKESEFSEHRKKFENYFKPLLFSDYAITAFSEKLITFDHILRICDNLPIDNLIDFITLLFSCNGIIALRERLITADQVLKCDLIALALLLSNKGIIALREKLITAEPGMTRQFLDSRFSSKKLNDLIQQAEKIPLGSEEAFAFIRACLKDYSNPNKFKEAFTSVVGVFTNHLQPHHTAFIAVLLAKDEYKTFDKKTLTNYLADLKGKINVDQINPNGDVHAICVVAKHFVGVDFDSIEAKKEVAVVATSAPANERSRKAAS